MQEREALRWLQLTYKVPSEPSQKRVWVWRHLQQLGAYALQNSVYLLPFSEEIEKRFRQLAHEIHEMGGEASIFAVVALDQADEQRMLQTLVASRTSEYKKVMRVCARFLAKANTVVSAQQWSEQVHAEFAEVLEKVHVLFRAAKRHDLLGPLTAEARATAAEALAVSEQVFRTLVDKEFARAQRLLEMHQELFLVDGETERSREASLNGSERSLLSSELQNADLLEPPL